LLLRELDDVADVPRRLDSRQDRHLAPGYAGEGLEAEVARDPGASADGSVVVASRVQPRLELVNRPLVLLHRFAEAPFTARAAEAEAEAEPERPRPNRRPVHHHDGAREDVHLLDGPPGQVERGPLTGETARPAAARQRERVRDPVRTRHRDVLARRVNGRPRLEVRIEA